MLMNKIRNKTDFFLLNCIWHIFEEKTTFVLIGILPILFGKIAFTASESHFAHSLKKKKNES